MWNDEADVVVVGYGGAGAAAAITAHDARAKVILLEKLDKPGGNTKYAGGTLRQYLDTKKAAIYFEPIVNRTVSREMIQAFVEESERNPQWMEDMGAELIKPQLKESVERFPPAPHVIWPHLPGSEGMGGRYQVKGDSTVGGINLSAVLWRNVEKRGIKVLLNTTAKKLVTNEQKEIIGVAADSPSGEILLKAKRGVVLTCGGFQYNREMQLNYLGIEFYAQGCLGNTGDGIRMAQEVGADLWHMTGVSCGIGYKFPEYDMPIGIGVRKPQYIYVDQTGNRFIE
jgi:succinate dehydrogenase/fumarate reductase flavoprotein subunit